jgi:predicted ATPase
MSAIFHYFRREPAAVRERVEAAMAVATEKGLSYWQNHGLILRGWLLFLEGRPDAALSLIRQGLSGFLAMGAELTRTWQLGLLATACGSLGRADEGLGIVDEAFALVDKNGERMYEPELHRVRGELLLRCAGDRQGEAEACFQRALAMAREQEARWWELRAATSLGRLWRAQGRRTHAHEIVGSIYSWFTEGLDMPDLRDARDLLRASTTPPH